MKCDGTKVCFKIKEMYVQIKFSDKNDVSDWAAESVAVLAENGIMKGTSDTTLSPLSNTTIQEAILLDLRIYKLFN